MKFNLIDKIEVLSDTKVVAVKYVSLAEEYLADHFPTFPVLPGVMMLEAATQACGWLLHHRSGFAKSFAVMKEAKNVKYGHFVAPANFLRVEAEWLKETNFKVTGSVGDRTAFTARLEIAYFDLAEKQPELAHLDGQLKEHNRKRFELVKPATASVARPATVAI